MSTTDHVSLAADGGILELILTGPGVTRAGLIAATGLARGTVTGRLAALLEAGLIREEPEARKSSGGRPARTLGLNPAFGYVLTADIGQSHTRVAVTDLKPSILADHILDVDIEQARARTLSRIADSLETLLSRLDPDRPILGIGISLPAPVDIGAGCVSGPSIMTGWDDFDIPAWFESRFGVPAFVDNDVKLLALAEHRTHWPTAKQFLFIKAGTSIGSGIIHSGQLYRGAQGSSGDIGHVRLRSDDAPLCRCGKFGCLEAQAGGWAMARELRAAGIEAHDARDVLALVEAEAPMAIELIRRAGLLLGEVAADLVSILNPDVIVVGGTLSGAGAGSHMLSGITEIVKRRCLPLATRALQIVEARSDERGGIVGAAHLVIETRIGSKRAGTLPLRRQWRALDVDMMTGTPPLARVGGRIQS